MKKYVCRKEHFGGLLLDTSSNKMYKINYETFCVIKEMKDKTITQLQDKYKEYADSFAALITYLKNIDLIDENNEVRNIEIIENDIISEALTAPLKVFIEVTSNCNLRCIHCFNSSGEKKNEDINLGEYENLFKEMQRIGITQVKITGGEPFLRNDILEILLLLDKYEINYIIHTNGLLIDENLAKQLSSLKYLMSVRVSLDGYMETNDFIRGCGVFHAAINGIKTLKGQGVGCGVNYTINKMNYKDIEKLIEYLERECPCDINIGIYKIAGRAKNNYNTMQFATNKELTDCLIYVKSQIDKYKNIGIKNEIEAPYRAQVDNSDNDMVYLYGDKFGCAAGHTSCTINSKGDVYPCGLFSNSEEYVGGNIKSDSLFNIWSKSTSFKMFRELTPNDSCSKCNFFKVKCTGGCRGNAFNYCGDIEALDPNCSYFSNLHFNIK